MLLSFLEEGTSLVSLSKEQRLALGEQFILYCVSAQPFSTTLRKCKSFLDDDQVFLEPVIRAKLQSTIADCDCNAKFKPAILSLAAGDDIGFRALNVTTKRTRRVIDSNKLLFNKLLKSVKYPIESLGPKHLASIEADILPKLNTHISRFAYRKAKFLTIAEPGKSIHDVIADLQIYALIALRNYYPYREGLHLVNSIKTSVTNRGNTMITAATTAGRKRLVQLDTGETYSIENSGMEGIEDAQSVDPRKITEIVSRLSYIAKQNAHYSPVIDYLTDLRAQDSFLDFCSDKYSLKIDSSETAAKELAKNGVPYFSALAAFLRQDKALVKEALLHVKSCVI